MPTDMVKLIGQMRDLCDFTKEVGATEVTIGVADLEALLACIVNGKRIVSATSSTEGPSIVPSSKCVRFGEGGDA